MAVMSDWTEGPGGVRVRVNPDVPVVTEPELGDTVRLTVNFDPMVSAHTLDILFALTQAAREHLTVRDLSYLSLKAAGDPGLTQGHRDIFAAWLNLRMAIQAADAAPNPAPAQGFEKAP